MAKSNKRAIKKVNRDNNKKKKSENYYEKQKREWITRIVAMLIITAILGAGFLFEDKIDKALGYEPPTSTTEEGSGSGGSGGDATVTEVDGLTIHFIDVGQGDACVVELPDDRTMMIDAGENKTEVKEKLSSYVEENILDDDGTPIDYFDYFILTHSDSDHSGSMAYILDLYPAKTVYRPNEEATYSKNGEDYRDPALDGVQAKNRFWGDEHGEKSTLTYKNAIEAAYEANSSFTPDVIVTNPSDNTQNVITSVKAGVEYSIKFYSPLSSSYNDHNNYSPIIIINYGGKSITVTGDAEKENEAEFVEMAKEGEGKYSIFTDAYTVDVIKLGHHGSRTSSSEDFLEVMTTEDSRSKVMVVISCGEGNSYGHPHPEVLTRLSEMGFAQDRILRTDIEGDIVFGIVYEQGEFVLKQGDAVIKTPDKDNPTESGFFVLKYSNIALVIFGVALALLILIPLGVKPIKRKRR